MCIRNGWSTSIIICFSNKVLSTYSVSIKISFRIDLIAYSFFESFCSTRNTLPKVPRPRTMMKLKSSNVKFSFFVIVDRRLTSLVWRSSLDSSIVNFLFLFLLELLLIFSGSFSSIFNICSFKLSISNEASVPSVLSGSKIWDSSVWSVVFSWARF